jgi:SAM-dependent MidA family methyltransferase
MIRDRITDAGGWIDFSEFMELALYAPGMGYYSAGAQKFGAAGDFITAPELSSLYSECIAQQIADVLRQCENPEILEIGAGTGAMAADILRTLEARGSLPDRYLILEVSAELRQRQRQTLQARVPNQISRIEWLDALPARGVEGVILGNEVLDALPVSRFRVVESGPATVAVECLGVGLGEEKFVSAPGLATDLIRERVQAIEQDLGQPFPAGYTSEICPSLPAFIHSLGDTLTRGMILLVDYGLPRREFFHADRTGGTLMCHYRHHVHTDPFMYPGLQDITAWVDFTTVAEAATACGFDVAGFTTQAHFLVAAGITENFESGDGDVKVRLQRSAELQTLLMPGQMGENFKFIGLSREIENNLRGFSGRDLRHTL